MLSLVSVRNIVLIDKLDLELDSGLTVLTGETGAGKSILLDALALALGGRGDQSLVRTGEDSGQVSAVFSLGPDHPVRQLLRDNDIQDQDETILRRVQYVDGRTRAYINDQPVSAALMRQVGALAVEIHGQHADRALIDPATHRELLDVFAGHGAKCKKVRSTCVVLVDAEKALDRQRAAIGKAQEDEDYARHVVSELEALALEHGEEEVLATRRQHLMSLEKSADEVREVDDVLNGSNSPSQVISSLTRRILRKGAEDLFSPLAQALNDALTSLDQSAEALEQLKRDMDFDPLELERVEERLFALRAAARKHGVSCDDLIKVLEQHQQALQSLESGATLLADLEAATKAAREAYLLAAETLSLARQAAAKGLCAAVEAELPDLKLGNARFLVDQEVDRDRIAPVGFDQITFHVQTNPGTNPGPMMKVASGGELSRFLLALKVVLADRGSAPVLIFDEIDTGVGGAVADAIGRRLARLADTVQVLSITHAPQVAARAVQHLLIEKTMINSGAHMRTNVRPLVDDNRMEEVARMLAGASVTEEARAAASRLLAEIK